ncbi:MAG: 23S rRNA (adenine(2030)-N(6))-methyltransferase RlmJ [Pseudomonadota bacterium]
MHVHERDGYEGLLAFLPPARAPGGLVLIDPPYEDRDEMPILVDALGAACRRWPTGQVCAVVSDQGARRGRSLPRRARDLGPAQAALRRVCRPAISR